MRTVGDCLLCTERCPQAARANDAAKGRMYATKEMIALLKKVESGQLVEVVRCKDCKRCDGFSEPDDIQPNEIGICKINMMAVKPHGFCSYGERKDGEG